MHAERSGTPHAYGHFVGCLRALCLLSKDSAGCCVLEKALPVLLQSRCSQQAPRHSYFNELELGFPPMSYPRLLKPSCLATELHSLLMHPADLHLFAQQAKNISKLPGL